MRDREREAILLARPPRGHPICHGSPTTHSRKRKRKSAHWGEDRRARHTKQKHCCMALIPPPPLFLATPGEPEIMQINYLPFEASRYVPSVPFGECAVLSPRNPHSPEYTRVESSSRATLHAPSCFPFYSFLLLRFLINTTC